MTTFHAIVYAIINGIAEFLPIDPKAHQMMTAYFLNWPNPSTEFGGLLALGAFLSVFIYFRHDWASIISSFLQVLIYRKKPMTLDERLPFFILLSALPSVIAWYYLQKMPLDQYFTPVVVSSALAGAGILLIFSHSMSKKNKGMFDWNIVDALVIGIFQLFSVVPGLGRMTGALTGAWFRNYNREASAKYAFFASAPLLLGSALMKLQDFKFGESQPLTDISWLTVVMTVLVTSLTGLIAIGTLMKQFQHKGPAQYAVYRILVAGGLFGIYWYRVWGTA